MSATGVGIYVGSDIIRHQQHADDPLSTPLTDPAANKHANPNVTKLVLLRHGRKNSRIGHRLLFC